jgi:outer membrane receptor protein involved in Fe transport
MLISVQKMFRCAVNASFAQKALTFTFLLSFFLFSPGLRAQTVASITGTITDASGAVVPNAKVTVTNNATNVTKTVTSNSAGTYVVTDLLPGTYTVTVEDAGFQTSVHNGVGVDVAHASTVDAVLQTGNAATTVQVTENAIALDTTQPDLNTTIENKVVQELPLEVSNGRGRQIDSFVFLAPGVTGSSFSKRINGGVDFQNEVVFNGIPMAQSETQGFQTIWNPPFELVDEFNVLRSSFSAQYGLAQGVITYHTKSGTNELHGDGFEIIRNNFFDAKGAYNTSVPIDKENNYGFSLGGPVIIPHLYNGKNKTFWHLSMEWYRENLTQTGFFSLPTAAEKAGDFSALPQIIYNPIGSGCSANGNTPGTPFNGNIIPTACFSKNSASLLQYMPNPTGAGFQNNQDNLEGVLPTRQNPWGFNIDHNINDKQSLHFAMWRDKQTSYGDNTGTHLPQSDPLADKTYYPDLGTVFILNYAYTATPHLVITAGASWLGELNFQLPERTGTQPSLYAAPGAPIVPELQFQGNLSPFTNGIGSSNTDSVNRKLGTVLENNYLWVKGKNTFNIGLEYRRTYQDDNECQQCAGNFTFSNNSTADPNYLANNDLSTTGNSFASFLLGDVDSSDRIGTIEERLRNRDYSLYVQDDIKWNPKLTFNIGVRWDIMQPFTEIGNNIVYFNSKIPDPAAGGLLGAATKFGNCTGCAGVDRAAIKWDHFSPRGGFSYQLNDKTVLQGGFSVNFLDGGAYEYGTSKVAVNYGNLLDGSTTYKTTGTTTPAFGSWDVNTLPLPGAIPFNSGLGTASAIDAFDPSHDGIAPYDVVWNIGVQRELSGNMLLTANYTGNRGNRLTSQLNPINQLNPQYLSLGAVLGDLVTSPQAIAAGIKIPYAGFVQQYGGSATVLQALLPYPQFASIFNNFDDNGSSLYNAMQIQVEKRYSNGLSFLVAYNLSRMMSNTSSGFTSFASASLNKNNQKAEWSVDNNDQPEMVNIAATYELPFGKGRQFMNRGGVANAVLGGWQISPLLTYASGTPLQITVPGDPLGCAEPTCTSNRPNVVAGVQQQFSYQNVYSGQSVLNAAAFSNPGVWAIGNEPRELSSIRNPFNLNENIALAKYFPIGEHVKLKLEIEYFNALNRVIFGSPDTTLTDTNFGKVINSQNNTQRQGQAFLGINF